MFMRSSEEGIQQVQKHNIQKIRHFSSAVSSVSSWMDMTIFFTFRTYYWRAAQIYPEWGKYLCLTSKMKSEWYWQGPKLTAISSALTKSILWYFYSKCIFVPMTMELFFSHIMLTERAGHCKNYKDQLIWFLIFWYKKYKTHSTRRKEKSL